MAKKNTKKKGGGQQFLSDEQFIRQRMRALSLGDCYITDGITEHGEGYVVVSRKHTGGRISFACYLLEEDTDDILLIEYPFGKDGKHCLVAHSRLEASQEGDRRMGDKSYKSYFEDVVLAESQDQLAEQGLTHQEAMQRMEQYMSHMPRWMFRGHSPSEMQEA